MAYVLGIQTRYPGDELRRNYRQFGGSLNLIALTQLHDRECPFNTYIAVVKDIDLLDIDYSHVEVRLLPNILHILVDKVSEDKQENKQLTDKNIKLLV